MCRAEGPVDQAVSNVDIEHPAWLFNLGSAKRVLNRVDDFQL